MISVPTENERTVTGMAEYIEREKLISDIDAAMENTGMGYVVCQTMKRYVKRVPAADVAPVRHGRWLHTEIEDDEEWGGIWHKWTCDNCGYSVGNNPNGTNYCPNCGARMDRKDDT